MECLICNTEIEYFQKRLDFKVAEIILSGSVIEPLGHFQLHGSVCPWSTQLLFERRCVVLVVTQNSTSRWSEMYILVRLTLKISKLF